MMSCVVSSKGSAVFDGSSLYYSSITNVMVYSSVSSSVDAAVLSGVIPISLPSPSWS
jgi:hypothetical protein